MSHLIWIYSVCNSAVVVFGALRGNFCLLMDFIRGCIIFSFSDYFFSLFVENIFFINVTTCICDLVHDVEIIHGLCQKSFLKYRFLRITHISEKISRCCEQFKNTSEIFRGHSNVFVEYCFYFTE